MALQFLNPALPLWFLWKSDPPGEPPSLPAIVAKGTRRDEAMRRDAPGETRWIEMDKEFGAEIVRAFAMPLRRLYTFDERDLPLRMAEALERLRRIERDLCCSGRPPASKPDYGGPPH